MGYKTTVSAQSQGIFDVDGEAGKNLIAGLSFKGNHPHIPKILDEAYNGIVLKSKQAMRYARDNYTYGLPDGYVRLTDNVSTAAIAKAIQTFNIDPVEIISVSINDPDSEFWGRKYLQDKHGWRESSGHMTNPPLLAEEGKHVSVVAIDFDRHGNLVIEFDTGAEDITTLTFLDNPKPNATKLYYHVRYRNAGSSTENYLYWIYEVGTGVYPELDVADEEQKLESPFMPIIPLRKYNRPLGPEMERDPEALPDEEAGLVYKKNANGDKIRPDTDLYRTSKHLLKILE